MHLTLRLRGGAPKKVTKEVVTLDDIDFGKLILDELQMLATTLGGGVEPKGKEQRQKLCSSIVKQLHFIKNNNLLPAPETTNTNSTAASSSNDDLEAMTRAELMKIIFKHDIEKLPNGDKIVMERTPAPKLIEAIIHSRTQKAATTLSVVEHEIPSLVIEVEQVEQASEQVEQAEVEQVEQVAGEGEEKSSSNWSAEDPVMQIFVKPIKGKTIILDVSSSDTIADVKVKLEELKGINPDEARLSYAGRNLEDGSTLSECNITDKSTLDLNLRLKGGMDACSSSDALFPLRRPHDDEHNSDHSEDQENEAPSEDSPDSSDEDGETDPKRIAVIDTASAKTLNITIYRYESVLGLKKTLRRVTGIKRRHILLNFKVQQLEDVNRLSSYGIKSGDVIHMSFVGGGGGKRGLSSCSNPFKDEVPDVVKTSDQQLFEKAFITACNITPLDISEQLSLMSEATSEKVLEMLGTGKANHMPKVKSVVEKFPNVEAMVMASKKLNNSIDDIKSRLAGALWDHVVKTDEDKQFDMKTLKSIVKGAQPKSTDTKMNA